jgi:hypothetical protein
MKRKQECRDMLAGSYVDALIQDIRFALRILRRSPGLTLVVVLTMALEIGATTAIFSVIDATLLQVCGSKDDELLGRLQQKLGKTKEDLRAEIEKLLRRDHLSQLSRASFQRRR